MEEKGPRRRGRRRWRTEDLGDGEGGDGGGGPRRRGRRRWRRKDLGDGEGGDGGERT